MSQAVHIVAIITPAPGKEARLKGLLTDLAGSVHKNEEDVSKYQMFEQYNAEGQNVFVVWEIYDNQAAWDGHLKTEYFGALGAAIQKESLVSVPLDIKTIKPFAGFASR